MRWTLTILAWLGTTAVLLPVCFLGVIMLAGPHSSLLPGPLQSAVLILALAVLLGGPILAARMVWRRTRRP